MGQSPMRIWCAIPLYNHASSICKTAFRCRKIMENVLVVDDGSTDLAPSFPFELERMGVRLIRHDRNRGKGAAILSALRAAGEAGADFLITIDADLQHDPDDLCLFLRRIRSLSPAENGELPLIAGCRDFSGRKVPLRSTAGRLISNALFFAETFQTCHDTQSGFRAYPVKPCLSLAMSDVSYGFETEILVRAVRSGIPLEEITVRTTYEPEDGYLTHYRLFADTFRIALVHLRLLFFRRERHSS